MATLPSTVKAHGLKAYPKLKNCKALCEIPDHENIREEVIVVGHDKLAVV
jgi:hypothetical protein